jgi:hypothetical protein
MVWSGNIVKGASIFGSPKTGAGTPFTKPTIQVPMTGSAFMLYIRGFQAASRGWKQLQKETLEEVYKGVLKVVQKMYEKSQATCPVGETGKLRRSGKIDDKSRMLFMLPGTGQKQFIDIHIRYGGARYGVEYAVYVHEGHQTPNRTGFVRGNPWLVRAARSYRRTMFRSCKPSIQKVWGRFVRQIRATGGTGQRALTGRINTGLGAKVTLE